MRNISQGACYSQTAVLLKTSLRHGNKLMKHQQKTFGTKCKKSLRGVLSAGNKTSHPYFDFLLINWDCNSLSRFVSTNLNVYQLFVKPVAGWQLNAFFWHRPCRSQINEWSNLKGEIYYWVKKAVWKIWTIYCKGLLYTKSIYLVNIGANIWS